MRAPLTVLIVITLLSPGFCQKKISFEPTPIHFVIKNAGIKVNGSIAGLEGFIMVDAQNVLLKVEGSVNSNTIKTGITLRDNHLKKPDYFYVKEFPQIFMTSTSITKTDRQKYVGNFDLTIKTTKRNVTFPFTYSATNDGYTLQGEFSINRLDYDLGESSIMLSDTVRIVIVINGKH